MAPKIKCPNCQQNEWFENNELSYIPTVMKMDDGIYAADPNNGIHAADPNNGIHVRLWRCNNCMYVLQFWEPD